MFRAKATVLQRGWGGTRIILRNGRTHGSLSRRETSYGPTQKHASRSTSTQAALPSQVRCSVYSSAWNWCISRALWWCASDGFQVKVATFHKPTRCDAGKVVGKSPRWVHTEHDNSSNLHHVFQFMSDGFTSLLQQIRGNCSPMSSGTTRSPPTSDFSVTKPGRPSATVPMIAASRPSG